MNYFNEKKNFGFGAMRLPLKGQETHLPYQEADIDEEQFAKMIDEYLAHGFNYFDTAHVYMNGKSEEALKHCLTSRYPRERYVLTNKLSQVFKKEEDIDPLFELQLKEAGVEYFDFYLMHAQNRTNFPFYKKCHAYEHAFQFKEQGRVKHVGISFHDTADVLEQILTEYPQIEVVQIQFNYLDYKSPSVQSKAVYDVCRKYGKPIIVMEPVKGGHLANLPPQCAAIFDALHGGSYASYALRFAAMQPGIMMVLSGMSNLEQMRDNISFMEDLKPLNQAELQAIDKVVAEFDKMNLIKCTACRYCTAGCPKRIPIPDLFSCYNTKETQKDWNADFYYNVHTKDHGKASDCIRCGQCERACPQHLPIRELLVGVAKEFEHPSGK